MTANKETQRCLSTLNHHWWYRLLKVIWLLSLVVLLSIEVLIGALWVWNSQPNEPNMKLSQELERRPTRRDLERLRAEVGPLPPETPRQRLERLRAGQGPVPDEDGAQLKEELEAVKQKVTDALKLCAIILATYTFFEVVRRVFYYVYFGTIAPK